MTAGGVISGPLFDELAYRLVLAWLRDNGDGGPLSTYRADPRKAMQASRHRLAATWRAVDALSLELQSTDRAVIDGAKALMAQPGLSPRDAFYATHAIKANCELIVSSDSGFDDVGSCAVSDRPPGSGISPPRPRRGLLRRAASLRRLHLDALGGTPKHFNQSELLLRKGTVGVTLRAFPVRHFQPRSYAAFDQRTQHAQSVNSGQFLSFVTPTCLIAHWQFIDLVSAGKQATGDLWLYIKSTRLQRQ